MVRRPRGIAAQALERGPAVLVACPRAGRETRGDEGPGPVIEARVRRALAGPLVGAGGVLLGQSRPPWRPRGELSLRGPEPRGISVNVSRPTLDVHGERARAPRTAAPRLALTPSAPAGPNGDAGS